MPSSYLQQLTAVSSISNSYVFPISDDPAGSGTLKKASFTQVQDWADSRYLIASGGLLTFCSGLPVSTGISGLGTGVATFLATPSSTNLASALTTKTGTSLAVFNDSPNILSSTMSGTLYNTASGFIAGTNSQGQGAIVSDINIISTTASNPSACTLPTAVTGRKIWCYNNGTNSVNIYPATGSQIDALGTNTSLQLPVGYFVSFSASNTTQWWSNCSPLFGTFATNTKLFVGTASLSHQLFPFTGSSWSSVDNTGTGLSIYGGSSASARMHVAITGASDTHTSATSSELSLPRTFAPTSGTGIFNWLNIAPTINQTGGANGVTRAVYINPTLTSAADFRAIEVVTGAVIFGSTLSVTGKSTLAATDTTAQTYTPASSGTATLDCSLGNLHEITMPTTGNITIALSNVTNNQAFEVSITWAGSGTPGTATWFSTIRWANGTTPTQTATLSKRDRFLFRRTGSGTYDGFIIGQNI